MNWRFSAAECRQRAIAVFTVLGATLTLSRATDAQCNGWGQEFSTAPNCTVESLCVYDHGSGPDLYVGGCFGEIINGPINANGIARWDGTQWHTLGSGLNGSVQALTVFDDGLSPLLYLGGTFTTAGGMPAYGVVRWTGSSYSTLAPGLAGGFIGNGTDVRSFATYDDGSGPALYAGGYLLGSNGVTINHVSKWSGSQWEALGTGLSPDGYVDDLAVFDDGSGSALFVGGHFSSAGGQVASGLARWDGSTWTPIGLGVIPSAFALHVWNDGTGPALYIGTGTVNLPGGGTTYGVAKWDGSTWSALGSGTNGVALAFATHDDGSGEALYVAGYHTQAGGLTARRIARWNGSTWSTLGDGIPNQISEVYDLAAYSATGAARPDLYLGGAFYQAASFPSYHIARWSSCSDPIDSFCAGDGSFAACPCKISAQGPPNYGMAGRGCNNSQSTGGALLVANGSPVPDSIVLRVTAELPTALTIFLQGDVVLPVSAPFGDGLRCIGGSLKRLYTKAAVSGTARAPLAGEPSVTSRSAALGDPIAPGSMRYYQTYYRDPNPNYPICTPPLGSTFNSSNGIRILW